MTLTPILWLLAFIPGLIALYFLKLRRQSMVVSSTLLWRKSLEDLHVNAPFQRLRRSLLLLLQLLILAAIIFASWRPRTPGEGALGRHLIVLMDQSASTTAMENGKTRLEHAREDVLDLVGGMVDGDRMVVLSFASNTRTVEPLTGDRTRLEAAVAGIESKALPTDLSAALRVAASVAETLPQPEIYVVGDGCYADLSRLPDEVKTYNIKLLNKGTPLDNVGITELDVRRTFEEGSRTEVFTLVENFGSQPVVLTCSLYVDELLRDARELTLGPQESGPVGFDCTDVDAGLARVVLSPGDDFALDDTASVRIKPPRTLSVGVVGPPDNAFLDWVLKANRRVTFRRFSIAELSFLEDDPSTEEIRSRLGVDLLVFDRECPEVAPPIPSLYVGCSPRLPEGTTRLEEREFPAILDWDRTHPVHRFVVYADVFIERSELFSGEPPYRSLLDADEGSLIGTVEFPVVGGRPTPAILIAFDILESNWPMRYSFSIFFANALSWLGGGYGEGNQLRFRAGEALVHRLALGQDVSEFSDAVFRSPTGLETPALGEASGTLTLPSADEVGVHELLAGGEVLAEFPVGLLSRRESSLIPSEEVDFGDFSVQVASVVEPQAKDLWKWFALAALAFLLVEWYVYNRRLLG